MGYKLPLDNSWLQGKKYTITRVALFVVACLLVLVAVFMLNPITEQGSRNQQVTTQMASTQPRAEVLLLASYNDADAATQLQRDGLVDLLRRSSVAADVEYLDTRNTVSNNNVSSTGAYGSAILDSAWGQALAQKISANGPYAAVICADDDALCFAEAARDTLFAQVPVVFMGINDANHATKVYDAGYATGLIEGYNMAANLKAAKDLQSTATKMLVITDNTATGIGNREQFAAMLADDANKQTFASLPVTYVNASAMSRDALAKEVAAAGSDTLLVYLNANADQTGKGYSASETAYFLSDAAKQPIFAITMGGANEGFAGTGLLDYENSGARAGEIVISVLNGTKPSDIALETYGTSGGIYDASVLNKYGLNSGAVPSGSTVLNQSNPFDALGSIFWPLVLMVLGLVCIGGFAFLGYRRTVLELDEAATQHSMLEERFYTDHLTDMPNMQWLTAFATSSDAARVRSIVGVALLGMDAVKETRGHEVAREIVKTMAERLNGLDTTFLVRVDRYEFVIGVGTSLNEASKLLSAIKNRLNKPVEIDGEEIAVSSCVGVFNRERGMSIEEMVSGVDIALRQAEELGMTSDVIFYDRELRRAVEHKLDITSRIKRCIEDDEFVVVYQPQIELATNEVIGYEALARMRGDQYQAEEFIAMAELNGQIVDVDRIITAKVVSQLATWKKRKQRMRPVSINFSSLQQRNHDYIQYLINLLDEHGIARSLVRLDIKESMFTHNIKKAMEFVTELREAGFEIAVDGYGEGYTSLSRVMQIPADVVKIDKRTTDAFLASGDPGVIGNLISLAHSAGKLVVIEGIESEEQLLSCIALKADIIQGFYFAEPMLPERAVQYRPIDLVPTVLAALNAAGMTGASSPVDLGDGPDGAAAGAGAGESAGGSGAGSAGANGGGSGGNGGNGKSKSNGSKRKGYGSKMNGSKGKHAADTAAEQPIDEPTQTNDAPAPSNVADAKAAEDAAQGKHAAKAESAPTEASDADVGASDANADAADADAAANADTGASDADAAVGASDADTSASDADMEASDASAAAQATEEGGEDSDAEATDETSTSAEADVESDVLEVSFKDDELIGFPSDGPIPSVAEVLEIMDDIEIEPWEELVGLANPDTEKDLEDAEKASDATTAPQIDDIEAKNFDITPSIEAENSAIIGGTEESENSVLDLPLEEVEPGVATKASSTKVTRARAGVTAKYASKSASTTADSDNSESDSAHEEDSKEA